MKNSGFTTIEMFIVVIIFSAIYLVSTVNVSSAFETDYDEISSETEENLVLIQAELYASMNEELFTDTTVIYIYVDDLIESSFYSSDAGTENFKIKVIKDGNDYEASKLEI